VREDEVRDHFDAIAARYDLTNDLLTCGLHRRWESLAVRSLALRPSTRLLDVGAGTGRMAALALSSCPSLRSVVLVDVSPRMLAIAAERVTPLGPALFALGRGECLPFADNAFDAVIFSYSLRNIPDRMMALREARRVLADGGRLVILEFSMPRPLKLAALYRMFLRRVVPLVGRLATGRRSAYEYLCESIQEFPSPEAVTRMIRESGLVPLEERRLLFGISTVFVAAARQP